MRESFKFLFRLENSDEMVDSLTRASMKNSSRFHLITRNIVLSKELADASCHYYLTQEMVFKNNMAQFNRLTSLRQ